MSFRWVYRDGPKSTSGSSQAFGSKEAAEEWMGTAWQELLEAGHLAATLMDGDEELYTMKLTAD